MPAGQTESPSQSWDAQLYEQRHSFVWKLGGDLIELLAPRPGERVLDLGSGTGQLTAEIAKRGVEVVGIDNSAEMVEQARRNHPDLRFEIGDARTFALDRPFDAVFSNAVLHWVKPPGEAVDRIRHALRPGGRFVAEFGGAGNVGHIAAAIRAALRELRLGDFDAIDPWYFPTVGQYAAILEGCGFEVRFATLFDRPTPLEGEGGMRDWVRMFGGAFLRAVPEALQEPFLSLVERTTRPALHDEGQWHADYRRLRVVAYKPSADS
jgi:trans-aconitate methyltransferase